MLTMNFVPVLLTLVLATGQLVLNPNHSAAAVAKAGKRLRAEQVIPDRSQTAPIPLLDQLSDADNPTPVTASDNFIRVANAPQTETCAEKWDKTVSHQSMRCIDGFWYKINFEQWSCKKPQQIIDHTHQQATKDACSAS